MLTTLIVTAAASQIAYAATPAGAILGQEALALAAAPVGSRFAAAMNDKSIKIFDAKTRTTMATFHGHTFQARAVAWSPQGDKIASGSENAEIRIWDVKTGTSRSIKGTHLRSINALYFNAKGTMLLSTSDDDTSKVWDLADTKKPVAIIYGKGINIYGTRWDKSGTRILAGTLGRGFLLYSPKTYTVVKALGGHPGYGVNDVDVNDLCTRAATAGRDGAVGIWDLKTKQRIAYLRGHTDWVMRVKFDPTGAFVASSATDGTVRVWNVRALKLAAEIPAQSYTGSPLAWVAGGNMLVTQGNDNYIRIFKFGKQ
ncbi:MAG: WD40 repeat domain-containing protein [Armatimonadetes bacterium]|nr:WD40 repeat domain-containing protein [Armatimonadota bacterium]